MLQIQKAAMVFAHIRFTVLDLITFLQSQTHTWIPLEEVAYIVQNLKPLKQILLKLP